MADDAGLINEVLAETSFLYGGNAAFVEDLYARWAADPNSVEPSWQAFFVTLHDRAEDAKRQAQRPAWTPAPAPGVDPGGGPRGGAGLALRPRRPVAGRAGQVRSQDRRAPAGGQRRRDP